ncbi:MAG: NADH-quinone oxidoreductase subunit C [Betaproteobacteria bacterium]
MIDRDSVLGALTGGLVEVIEVATPRANEAHVRVEPRAVPGLAEIALRQLGAELILIAADDRRREAGAFFVHYLFAHRAGNWFLHASARLDAVDPQVPSLAPLCYPASRFEREMRDLFGISIAGLPDPSPLVKHAFWPPDSYPLRKDAEPASFSDDGRPFPFTEVGGEGVYEIPVGPVHAGVIEPGHFRISVMGETVINLRSRLYFTHKGTEKLFEARLPAGGVELAERISGDTSAGHALAYSQAIEAAAGIEPPARARLVRVLLLELERIYNHVADVGAIANDTGFAVAHAHCFRIRERLLRQNKQLSGSRLLRGVICPGGLARDLEVPRDLAGQVHGAVRDFEEIVAICLRNTLLTDRLEGTGILRPDLAKDLGVLGYVARASGQNLDARRDHPFAAYPLLDFDVPVLTAGDVAARLLVRVHEVRESLKLVAQACDRLEAGAIRVDLPTLAPFAAAFGVVEGWRGRIVHWVMAGERDVLHRVKVVDPSFFNWPALSYALEGNIVPDFPLCNKSFNQSYSGNDL